MAFQFADDSIESTGRWLSLWAMLQRKEMRKGFEEAGANAVLRGKMTFILNEANRVSLLHTLKHENDVNYLF